MKAFVAAHTKPACSAARTTGIPARRRWILTSARRCACLCLVALGLATCATQPAALPSPQPDTRAVTATANGQSFASDAYGFSIRYPADVTGQRGFTSHYLVADHWKLRSGPETPGHAVFMLTLPGSDQVTAGELRIGVSEDSSALQSCTQPPSNVRGAVRVVQLDGQPFTTWQSGSAGMSHYLMARSYRSVHAQRCYAIDLLVIGTDPQVYVPPRTPPFSHQEAFARLQQLLQSFRFTP